MSLLFKISYGLYLLSANADGKDNGCIINTLMQQTSSPEKVSVTVNKANFTTALIQKSKKCVVNILSEEAQFELFKHFGMQSGRNVNKFANFNTISSQSGIKTIEFFSLGFMELNVEQEIDLGSHIMFVCSIAQSEVFENKSNPLTYAFYHANIKPKPQVAATTEETWVCQICNYQHKGPLPDDFICPICKHGKADFEKVK